MRTSTIGAFDAKNRFSELLDKALHGNETIVTKHGHPIAKIVPFRHNDSSDSNVFDRISKTRESIASKGAICEEGESWKDLARKGLRS